MFAFINKDKEEYLSIKEHLLNGLEQFFLFCYHFKYSTKLWKMIYYYFDIMLIVFYYLIKDAIIFSFVILFKILGFQFKIFIILKIE